MAVRQTAAHLVEGFEGRARAFVEIQQGCDHRCTFCVIPFARGPNRSVPQPLVVARMRQLVENGYREIVLTGVDICSWGADLPGRPTLGALVAEVLASVPELPRLRLSSLDPAAIDERLFRVLAEEPRLMPHLHLSLQAMDDLVLKRMKRRHGRADALAVAARARAARPDVVFGADLIAGFPTESEDMFANTLDAVEELGLTYLHVFPYSPRPGTPAARMPQVPGPVRQERAARLRAAGLRARARYFAGRVGTTAEVLVEKQDTGRCAWYAPISLGFAAELGTLISVRINAADDERLYAEMAL
jgi:threonylcarbamoyladenosine tRNA methylthiotransferase MtaB